MGGPIDGRELDIPDRENRITIPHLTGGMDLLQSHLTSYERVRVASGVRHPCVRGAVILYRWECFYHGVHTAAGWAAAAVTAGPPWSDRAMAEAGQAPPWWWGMGTRRPHPPMAVRHHGLVPGNSTRSDRLGAVASPLPQPSPPLSGYGRGAISVDEIIVPIVDIFLDDLKIWIIATAPGPIPAVNTSNYTVHDRQGRTVFRGVEIGGLTWDAVTLGHWLSVELPIVVTDRLAVGIEPAPSG